MSVKANETYLSECVKCQNHVAVDSGRICCNNGGKPQTVHQYHKVLYGEDKKKIMTVTLVGCTK